MKPVFTNIIDSFHDFIHPHRVLIETIKQNTKLQKELTKYNKKRVEDMMATLNGEDKWFLRVVRSTKESCDGVSK